MPNLSPELLDVVAFIRDMERLHRSRVAEIERGKDTLLTLAEYNSVAITLAAVVVAIERGEYVGAHERAKKGAGK